MWATGELFSGRVGAVRNHAALSGLVQRFIALQATSPDRAVPLATLIDGQLVSKDKSNLSAMLRTYPGFTRTYRKRATAYYLHESVIPSAKKQQQNFYPLVTIDLADVPAEMVWIEAEHFLPENQPANDKWEMALAQAAGRDEAQLSAALEKFSNQVVSDGVSSEAAFNLAVAGYAYLENKGEL